jgi:hypothetical protein
MWSLLRFLNKISYESLPSYMPNVLFIFTPNESDLATTITYNCCMYSVTFILYTITDQAKCLHSFHKYLTTYINTKIYAGSFIPLYKSLNILVLTICCKLINFLSDIPSFCSWNACWFHILYCLIIPIYFSWILQPPQSGLFPLI